MEIISLRHCGFDYSKILIKYIELYQDSFRDPSESEDPSEWDKNIKTEPYTERLPIYDIIIVGKNLDNDNCEIFGGCNVENYWKSKCALITYVAIKECYRKLGFAKLLFSFSKSSIKYYYHECLALLCETENPNLVEKSTINPNERIHIMDRLGGRRVDFNYIQPKLFGGINSVSYLFFDMFLCSRLYLFKDY